MKNHRTNRGHFWTRRQLRNSLREHCLRIEALEDRRLLTVEIEPNDTPAQATFLPDNQVIEGRVLQTQDVDFFRVNLDQGDRFSIDPDNINDALFSPTLPPPIEIFDDAGNLLAVSEDGRDVEFTAQEPGDYFIRLDSSNAYGTFTESYAMQTRVRAFSGTGEQEPNGTPAQANDLASGATFRGVLAAADVDIFTFDLEAGDGVSVDFAGLANSSPGARLLTDAGTVISNSLEGLGLSHVVDAAGTYFLEVLNNTLGTASEYVGVFNTYASAVLNNSVTDGFAGAANWDFVRDRSFAVGMLSSMDDVDVFKIEVDDFAIHDFNLSPNGGDELSEQNRVMTLFNQHGQFLAYSTTGRLDQENVDAGRLGTYYVAVAATSPAGLGSYGLRVDEDTWFASQRDVPRHFIDFNQQMPSHQNFNWVNSFAVPEAIPFVVGMFDAKYRPFGVESTTQLPDDNDEIVTQGYGDFGDIGAGGWGGGSRGQRSTSGRAVTSATQTSWNSLSYGSINTLNHEFGHSAGLPHARLANAFMSYVGTDELLPVGEGFAFRGTDSRRPGTSRMNTRNYLDWSTEAGAQVPELEPNDLTDPQDLRSNFFEMTADLTRRDDVSTPSDPNLLRTGDFDGDGDADVLIAASGANQLQTFIGDGSGGFTPAATQNVDQIGWWTEPVAVGDFNEDGRDDVVHVSNSQNRASILLSNAAGNLGPPSYANLPRGARSVAVADFDSDGNLDFAVTHWPDEVSVLLGNGNGTFGAASTFKVGQNPYSITVGDFNGDNILDLATANFDDDTVSVLIGRGNGTFETSVSLPTSEDPKGITSGDFNGDGFDDIATVNRIGQDVSLYFGSSAGVTFSSSVAGHHEGETISVGDVNRDGIHDLLVGGFSTHFMALLGNGQGEFTRPVSFVGGSSESTGATADFNSDGHQDLVIASYFSDHFNLYLSEADDARNNSVTIFGEITAPDDVDNYRFEAAAGEVFSIDIDSAEFQYPLDAHLRVLLSDGTVVTESAAALDLDSGLDSVDPYLLFTADSAGEYIVEVSGKRSSVGDYRLKVTPAAAEDQSGPRILAMYPDGGDQVESTEQITFFFDDLIHPDSLTAGAIVVTGASSGVVSGSALVNPLDSSVTWTADSPLQIDDYSVTLIGANGLTDLRGNPIDGESTTFSFPEVSGDGTPSGDFTASFSVTSTDTTAASVNSVVYDRDPYQRGQFTLWFDDQLSIEALFNRQLSLRGAGSDGQFGTSDDSLAPLDVVFNKITHFRSRRLDLYTRGIPDPDFYRIEGSLRDAAGNDVSLAEEITIGVSVPQAALSRDADGTLTGLTGSYVNQSLRTYAMHDDWRASQTISGTRVDYTVDFDSNSFGNRADVGVTGGTDANWDNFSAQWDGWITIPVDGTRLQTRSDDGSRLWIDVNGDGTFGGVGSAEFADNGWGTGHAVEAGAVTEPLSAGRYQIRVQYEEGNGGNQMLLEWITPGVSGQVSGYGHGPSVVGMSITPGTVDDGSPSNKLEVSFSGGIDASTLTAANFQVLHSTNASFFDADDAVLPDADGVIAWDPVRRVATWELDGPMPSGYYRIDLNGDAGGITSTAGQLLDGEYLSNHIAGNTNHQQWNVSPSGDGIPGGDYVATFTVSASALTLTGSPLEISEKGGTAEVTLYRTTPRGYDQPLTVSLSAEPSGRITFPASVTFPAGATSATFTVRAIDNSTLDGDVQVQLSASANEFDAGSLGITLLDHEELRASINRSSISERDGTATVTIVRPFSNGSLIVDLFTNSPDRLSIPSAVTFADGARTASFAVAGIDNNLLDGTTTALIRADAAGTIGDETEVNITDHEQLQFDIVESELNEDGGVSEATITRTDSRGELIVRLESSDETEATAPQTVVIRDGQLTSSTFDISAVDDGVGDGTQTVSITARADGYLFVTDSVSVIDAQQLTLVLDRSQINERDGTATARVGRSQPRGPVDVFLQADVSGQVDLPDSVSIADGALLSEPFVISAIDNGLLDGTRTIQITADASDYWPVTTPLLILDHEVLEFTVDKTAMSENGGSIEMTVRRADSDGDLTVRLRSNDTGELRVPATITIPDGQLQSTVFNATAVDESFHDGAQSVTVTALAVGYEAGAIELEVLDEERLSSTISSDTISEEGGQATVTLRRHNFDVNRPLTVNISTSVSGRVQIPDQVEFRAGASTVSFNVVAIDNATLDGDIEIVISASHPDYLTAESELTITDREVLSLESSHSEISEFDGQTTLTISRPAGSTGDLIVNLAASDDSEVTLPDSVLIEGDEYQASFVVQGKDDDAFDGPQAVTITASAEHYESVQTELTVLDYEVLEITTSQDSMVENGTAITATLTRPAGHTAAMTVDLAGQDSRLRFPDTVQFAAGETQVEFSVEPVDNALLDGTKEYLISATASGMVGATTSVRVIDHEQLTIEILESEISEFGGATTATVRIESTDVDSPVDVDILINDRGEATSVQTVTIPGG